MLFWAGVDNFTQSSMEEFFALLNVTIALNVKMSLNVTNKSKINVTIQQNVTNQC